MSDEIKQLHRLIVIAVMLQAMFSIWVLNDLEANHKELQQLAEDLPRVHDHDDAVDATHVEILNEIDHMCGR